MGKWAEEAARQSPSAWVDHPDLDELVALEARAETAESHREELKEAFEALKVELAAWYPTAPFAVRKAIRRFEERI